MISVVIPSKARAGQSRFLLDAILSIRPQLSAEDEIIVAVDKLEVQEFSGIKYVQGCGGQAAAMNAGAGASTGAYLTFLEDDDTWRAGRVDAALEVLKGCDFTSSTQLEHSTEGILRVNDFPTPSGWFMKRTVWETVGPFNPEYRFHLDNEWLGRLSRTEFRRVHLVENTAPETCDQAALYRPWLASIVKWGGLQSILQRSGRDYPLINRLVHAHSNMTQIWKSQELSEQSMAETKKLQSQYGYMPR